MKVNKFFFCGFFVFILLSSGCINQQQSDKESSLKIGVVVSILPQKHFVERIGGDKIQVTVMVPPGASPHTYEPTPAQMKAVSEARLYAKVGSGIDFEKVWMDRVTAANREMMIVDCSEGITLIEAGEHHHEDGYEKEKEGGLDPHIWTSVKNAKVMVENICQGLVRVDPGNREYYLKHRDDYLADLEDLEDDLEKTLGGLESGKFMVFHPAWGYLAHDYGLEQISVEQGGKEPSAKELAELIDEAKEENIRVVFASPQLSRDTADSIASGIGGTVVLIDPLAEDYISNMRRVSSQIRGSLTEDR